MTESFTKNEKNKSSVVLLEYPRKGIWAVGFATKENKGVIAEKVNEAISEGWEPVGGIAHSEDRQENPYLLQAMINRNASPVQHADG